MSAYNEDTEIWAHTNNEIELENLTTTPPPKKEKLRWLY